LLTDELKASIENAKQLVDVEDLYRPYKEKKKTKATIAIKRGLEPLALSILEFQDEDLETLSKSYLSDEVPTTEDALEGARHIIAEKISDTPIYRKWIRNQTFENGVVETKLKKNAEDPKKVYEMYYDFKEAVKRIKLFRVLAINRGEKEKVLRVKITMDEDRVHSHLHRETIEKEGVSEAKHVELAYKDAYKRLIAPSVEREIRSELTEKADDHAIDMFSENLESLLLSPPLKGRRILGIDPAYRTGCKLAALDELGTLKQVDVIYPHPKRPSQTVDAKTLKASEDKLLRMMDAYRIDVIAIGNGTASRETEAFVAKTIKKTDRKVVYTIVNEAGASVYSASPLAKKEFPALEVEERSAVSIARRLLDPLSELVKIDPKSIGVGQYQHDVNQSKLSEALDFTVETAVNKVGVDANVASASLLHYVSGLNSRVASNIIAHREENGAFKNRKALKKVKGIGAKSYEQSIGFLRITDGDNPLDKTPIHPESYEVAKTILKSVGADLSMIGTDTLREKIRPLKAADYLEITGAGEPTIKDIFEALMRPLRDPRDDAPEPILKSDVLSLEDLKPGMKLKGTVRNVVDFGAFVDCGVKEDGLVHISKLAKRYVKNPMDIVQVGDVVDVWVENVDIERGRLQLSMVDPSS
ncbi:MAG: helix-hairpin-helix domain-containing protein, partial [Bacillota bacterium]